jgi:carboxylesterase
MDNPYMVKPHLDGEPFTYQGNKTGFLLVHGFTATTTEIRPLAERLHALEYTVKAPLLPSHGTHPDELNKTKWQDWYGEVKQAYLELVEVCDQVWLGGESMGALLSLRVAAEFPDVAGLMLFSPAMVVRNLKWAYLLQFFQKHLDKSQKEDDLAWKGYNVYPLKGAVQLRKLQKIVRRDLSKVTQPVMVVVSEADETVDLSTGQLIIDSVSSTHKRLLVMKESPHTMLLGAENEKIIDEAIAFFKSVS